MSGLHTRVVESPQQRIRHYGVDKQLLFVQFCSKYAQLRKPIISGSKYSEWQQFRQGSVTGLATEVVTQCI